MRLEFFPFPALLGLALLALLLPVSWWLRRSFSFLLFFSVFWVFLLLAAGLTLFPMPLYFLEDWFTRQPLAVMLSRVNLIPFFLNWLIPGHPWLSRFDMAANILMTIPLGFFFNLLAPLRIKHAVLLVAVIGLMFEGAQLALSLLLGLVYRSIDINDVLMNGLGALIGYVAFRVLAWLYLALLRLFQAQPRGVFAYLQQAAIRVEPGRRLG
jgi:glycopeptide antibiotics resistance protein